MSLKADLATHLATLRAFAPESTARVEAEIARLEREKGDLRAAYLAVSAKNAAAEAEAARLRDGLRRTLAAIGHGSECACDICAPIRLVLKSEPFSGQSRHRCKDSNMKWVPCPPDLCEADSLLGEFDWRPLAEDGAADDEAIARTVRYRDAWDDGKRLTIEELEDSIEDGAG